MVKIITAPNSILAQKAKPVGKIDKSILRFIEETRNALFSAKDPEGVGLAAPQVGKNLKIFIAKPTPKSAIQVFINPKIKTRGDTTEMTHDNAHLEKSQKTLTGGKVGAGPRVKQKGEKKLEGCLSLPNIWGQVKRKPEVILSYLDEKGQTHTRKFRGFMATIIQHELDHLNGILFTKRVLEQKGILYRSYKDEKGEVVFEEIEI